MLGDDLEVVVAQVHGPGVRPVTGAGLWPRHLQRRGPAAQGGVVLHAQRQPEQVHDGAEQAFDLPVGEAEDGPERERRQDGQRRVPGLTTGRGSAAQLSIASSVNQTVRLPR